MEFSLNASKKQEEEEEEEEAEEEMVPFESSSPAQSSERRRDCLRRNLALSLLLASILLANLCACREDEHNFEPTEASPAPQAEWGLSESTRLPAELSSRPTDKNQSVASDEDQLRPTEWSSVDSDSSSESSGATFDVGQFAPEPTTLQPIQERLEAFQGSESSLVSSTTLDSLTASDINGIIEDSHRPEGQLPKESSTLAEPFENGGLVRNRKSPENGTEVNANALKALNAIEAPTASELSLPAGNKSEKDLRTSSMSSPALLDYDDFDLDYQLKLTNNANGSDLLPNLIKRDYEKAPNWSALIKQQSHLFNSSAYARLPDQPELHLTPPILPSLLTVKSAQLTSQELNSIRPHFLLNQESYAELGAQQALDQSQAYPANGDLLATPSGSPLGPAILLPANGSLAVEPENSKSVISLVNGSPVVRHSLLGNRKQLAEFNGSRLMDDPNSLVTTIVVDSTPPTEAPPPSSSSPSAASQRQPNQWHNYPQPNLHQNPLLLHHILHKPANYVQHVGQQPQEPAAGRQPLPVGSTSSPANSHKLMIVERPTLSEEDRSNLMTAASVNRTQLEMQLNELRSMQRKQEELANKATPAPRRFWQPAAGNYAQFKSQLGVQPMADEQRPLSSPKGLPVARLPPEAQLVSGQPLASTLQHLLGYNPSSSQGGTQTMRALPVQSAAPLYNQQQVAGRQQGASSGEDLARQPSSVSQVELRPEGRRWPSGQQSNMSEEDMSSYVAQLAAFNSLLSRHQESAEPSRLQAVELAASPELLRLAIDHLRQEQRQQSEPDSAASGQLQHSAAQDSPPSAKSWEELLREAKLIALSNEVQAQIYSDHLSPLFPQAPKHTWPPYSSLGVQASSSSVLPAYASGLPRPVGSEALRTLQGGNGQGGGLGESQRQVRKDQLAAELLKIQQRRKQMAFVEALRERISQLQSLSKETSPAALLNQANSSIAHATPDDFDELHQQASKKPIPDWFERQIIQESFLHESARVHPLGHSFKSTFVGRQPFHGFRAAPPVAMLRPAGSSAHANHLARPIYPLPVVPGRPLQLVPQRLRPLQPLPSYNSGQLARPLPPFGSMLGAAESSGVQANLAGAQQAVASNSLLSVPFAPLNPTRILLDRFPAASAPAYLFKLPTPTGGTITASGSLVPPRLFRANRPPPLAPLGGFLGAAGFPPRRLRLVAPAAQGTLQPATSFVDSVHRLPATSAGYFPYQEAYQSVPLAHSPSTLTHSQTLFLPAKGSDQPPSLNQSSQLATPAEETSALKLDSSSTNSVRTSNQQEQEVPASALARLQQATASLVELTGLASLVEEMVSGPEGESSPVVALANAINTLSAAAQAQSALLNTQASSNGLSSLPSNQLTGTGAGQLEAQLQSNNRNQPAQILWLKNMLNVPAILREKALLNKGKEGTNFERLLASTRLRQPTTRLKVKYIKVPVAVYETLGDKGDQSNLLVPPKNQLFVGGQPAEISTTGSSQEHPTNQHLPSPSSSSSSAISSSGSASLKGSPTAEASTLSAEHLLFDELSADSTSHIPLANNLIEPSLLDSSIELPMISLKRPSSSQKYFPLARTPIIASGDLLNPVESVHYYSMMAEPSTKLMARPQTVMSVEPAGKSGGRRKKKKKNGEEEEDNEEEGEEEDDDDLLSKDDLPLLESIISSVMQPSPVYQQSPPSHLASGWLRGARGGSFGGLHADGSTKMESYAAPGVHGPHSMGPLGKYSRRFTIGEVVGALGAKRLISSLLSRKKSSLASRTNKRAVKQTALKAASSDAKANQMAFIGLRTNSEQTLPKITTRGFTIRYPGSSVYDQQFKFSTRAPLISKLQLNVTENGRPKQPTSSQSSRLEGGQLVQEAQGLKVAASNEQELKSSTKDFHLGAYKQKTKYEEEAGKASEGKMSMALYHVVADHYSKLNPGSASLQKTTLEHNMGKFGALPPLQPSTTTLKPNTKKKA